MQPALTQSEAVALHLLVALDVAHDAPPVPLHNVLQMAATKLARPVYRHHNRRCLQSTWQYPQMHPQNVRICEYLAP